MKIGMTKINISPNFAIKPYGFIQQTKELTDVHDPLYARVIGFFSDESIHIHISCDLIGLPLTFQQQLKERFAKIFGRCDSCTISCTHTHYAPTPHNKQYLIKLEQLLLDDIQKLHYIESSVLESSYQSILFEKIGTSRITNHKANVYLNTFTIYHQEEVIACLIVHNCHPTILDAHTDFFTSEYPGYALSQLEKMYPNTFFSFMQGAAGDISTRFTRKSQTYEAVKELAMNLVLQVDELIKKQEPRSPLTQINYQSINLKLEHDTQALNFELPESLSDRELETIEYGKIMRERLLSKPQNLVQSVVVSSLRFNRFTLVFAPNELFSSYLDALDTQTSALACYSNGYAPYVTGIQDNFITYERFTDTLTTSCKQQLFETLQQISKALD